VNQDFKFVCVCVCFNLSGGGMGWGGVRMEKKRRENIGFSVYCTVHYCE
jgi:hypothetical protein